ncbi:MAG: hypothetical protein ACREDP_17095, partial [Bradyrhizobium sp.]
MTARESFLSPWHGFVDWLQRVPTRAARDRRNALTLQAILVVIATTTLFIAIASCTAKADTTGIAEYWLPLAVSAYAWSCFCL